jgi:CheY-like chemotaxis protein
MKGVNDMKRHILWIEDDYYDIQGLVRPLTKAGFRISAATSAVQGFRKALDWQQYDLIVVDLIMTLSEDAEPVPQVVASWDAEPYIGLGLAKWLKQDLKVECPILILSVVRDPISTYGLKDLGLDQCLLKRGLKPSAVKSKVFELLGLSD